MQKLFTYIYNLIFTSRLINGLEKQTQFCVSFIALCS